MLSNQQTLTWDIDEEIGMLFNTDDRNMRDFWYEFDLVLRKYTGHNRAYQRQRNIILCVYAN